jgi:DNA repair protein RAD5
VENLEFSPLERRIYDSIYADAKRNFDQLNAKGLVSRNYTHILAMLMRLVTLFLYHFREYRTHSLVSLRRAVLHPNLVLSSDEQAGRSSSAGNTLVAVDDLVKDFTAGEATESSKTSFADSVVANLETDDTQECPICLDVMQAPMIIPRCLHQW